MTVLGAVLLLGGLASAALAQDGADAGQVDVLEMAGYLDPVLVDFISSSIERGRGRGRRRPSCSSSTARARW